MNEHFKKINTWLVGFLRSFAFAFQGIFWLFRDERNAQVQLLAAIIVVFAGNWVGLMREEWLWIILAMALVFVAEAVNSSIECLADALHPDFHPLIGRAKDLAAGASLIAAIAAGFIGGMIFWPKFRLFL